MSQSKYNQAKFNAEQILQTALQVAVPLSMKPDKITDDILKSIAIIGNASEQAIMYLQGQGFSQKQSREAVRKIIAKIAPKIIMQG